MATENKPIIYTDKKSKLKALGDASNVLEKTHGAGIIFRMGSKKIVPVEVIPTGIPGLDIDVIGVGGFPRGRVVEIFGPEGSGKTTIALQVIAEAQALGGTAAFVDAEHALDLAYAAKLGVNVNELFISQPDYGEQALEVTDGFIDTGAVDIVVVDSVAALVPKAELEGEMGDSHMGLQARLMSQALRKLTGKVRKTHTCLVFINQIREKIGVMFGSPETTTGGRALKFYASLRLDIRRVAAIKDGDKIIGNRTKIKAVKNRLAPPFRENQFDLYYGKGLDKVGNLIEVAADYGIVEKAGSWYSAFGERLGQGLANSTALVESNPDLRKKLSDALRKAREKEITGDVQSQNQETTK